METPSPLDPEDAPTGLPEEAESEPPPLGTDGDPAEPGEDAMPGIASDGDPPSAG